MVKYSDETKSEFVARVMRSKGFGTTEIVAQPRKPITERSREEIIKSQAEREAQMFGKLYQFGSGDKWGWSV